MATEWEEHYLESLAEAMGTATVCREDLKQNILLTHIEGIIHATLVTQDFCSKLF